MSTFTQVMRYILIIILVCLLALVLGSMIGYAIGGGNPFAVFLPSTWAHIFEFLK
ncbi:DNA-directed RNA polymerase subunit beta [Lacticaseibacillus zhaodongensis]|uniref:DNA-directed RNA polymerase subunit beta n=1 Tax=Lacticaseibacillus zhaodongensis TaxID=2668065 RepID=UPI0012D3203B|nr:DNA-directed RNA polymerase subunit beta [Lacticaseibacillus zhaodongensis]